MTQGDLYLYFSREADRSTSCWKWASSIAFWNTVEFRLHSVSLRVCSTIEALLFCNTIVYSWHMRDRSMTSLLIVLVWKVPIRFKHASAVVLLVRTMTNVADNVSENDPKTMGSWYDFLLRVRTRLLDYPDMCTPPRFWGVRSHGNLLNITSGLVKCCFHWLNATPKVTDCLWW